jgi:spore germination protein YaaH
MKARYPIAAALTSALVIAGCGNSPQAAPKNASRTFSAKNTAQPMSTAKSSSKLKVIGFWAHHKALPASSLGAYKHSLTYLAPLWYSATASGALTSHVDPSVQAEDQKLHIPVLALVNDGTGTQSFLTSAATRKATVQNIDHIVATNHYQGVDIDFEPPHTRVKAELTLFMTQLRDSLPQSDVIVLDVVPHSGGAYDYKTLAPEVSQFQLMTYDQHADGTVPGPVAALNWATSITKRLMSLGVPGSKIYLGIALYGYRWTAGSTHATTIPYDAITPAIRAKASWNSRYGEMSAAIGSDIYWWENRKGISQKIAFAKSQHLAGVALWQVGYATPAIYDELIKDIGAQP